MPKSTKAPVTYVDGFVLAVAKKKLPAYKKMAAEASKVWMKFGALDYKECSMEDALPKGCEYPFSKTVKMKPDETVVFAYITYKSRAHRDSVNKKVMQFFEKKYGKQDKKKQEQEMPFDMKRMAYGGFKVLVSG